MSYRLAIVFKKQVFCRKYTCSHLYLIKIAQLYCPFAIPSSITIIFFLLGHNENQEYISVDKDPGN